MDGHFGQCVPCREQEDEVQDGRIMWFGKEAFQARDHALQRSRISSRRQNRLERHLKQVFEVVPSEAFHLGNVIRKTSYRGLPERGDLSETFTRTVRRS